MSPPEIVSHKLCQLNEKISNGNKREAKKTTQSKDVVYELKSAMLKDVSNRKRYTDRDKDRDREAVL